MKTLNGCIGKTILVGSTIVWRNLLHTGRYIETTFLVVYWDEKTAKEIAWDFRIPADFLIWKIKSSPTTLLISTGQNGTNKNEVFKRWWKYMGDTATLSNSSKLKLWQLWFLIHFSGSSLSVPVLPLVGIAM